MKLRFIGMSALILFIVITANTLSIGISAEEIIADDKEKGSEDESAKELLIYSNIDPSRAPINLYIPREFFITRPEEGTLSTQYTKYFITGVSDPSTPVYIDGEEIERLGDKGTFGVLVDLKEGENTFDFSQDGFTESVVIDRYIPSKDITIIDSITESSLFPTKNRVVNAGENLRLTCVAPSGAIVSVSFDGNIIELEQDVTEVSKGVPASFSGILPISLEYPKDVTTKVTPIEYILEYDDTITTYITTGTVYVVGENAKGAFSVSNYVGYVYNDPSNASDYKELLKQGATDYIKTQSGGYLELASGGFIPVELTEIIEGTSDIDNQITNISHQSYEKGEYFIIDGTKTPAYDCIVSKSFDTLSLRIYNSALASNSEQLSVSSSDLFSSIRIEQEEDTTVISLKLKKPSEYWGYNVVFDPTDGNMFFSIKKKPEMTSFIKPLKGITILIDPGHGGTDPGALGVAGTFGPSESNINLAHAYALEEKLIAMGATVHITRYSDEFVDLESRMRMLANLECDLFISLHHNSVDYSVDANTAKGTEAYYYSNISNGVTDKVHNFLIAGTERIDRSTMWSYYRVTIGHYAPSMLLELGFMSNPLEYERASDPAEIERVANSICRGVVGYFYGK